MYRYTIYMKAKLAIKVWFFPVFTIETGEIVEIYYFVYYLTYSNEQKRFKNFVKLWIIVFDYCCRVRVYYG